MELEVTGEATVHGNVIIVSVVAPHSQGLYVEMVQNGDFVTQLHVFGDTYVALFMVGDVKSVVIYVFKGSSEVGHGSYDVNFNGHLIKNLESGVCLGLFEH